MTPVAADDPPAAEGPDRAPQQWLEGAVEILRGRRRDLSGHRQDAEAEHDGQRELLEHMTPR